MVGLSRRIGIRMIIFKIYITYFVLMMFTGIMMDFVFETKFKGYYLGWAAVMPAPFLALYSIWFYL